jgi:hypothetical protein
MTTGWRFRAFAAGLAVVTCVHAAHAQVEPIRLEYSGVAECPAAAEFARGVFGRTSRARAAESADTDVRTFVVTITKSGSAFVGSLVVREADGKTSAREVTGNDCKSVSEALALATSLAIDPNASLAAPVTSPEAQGDVETAPATKGPPPAEPPRETPTEPSEPSGPEPPNAFATSLAFGPTAATNIGPRLALGASIALSRALRRPNRALSMFGVELSVLGTPPDSVETAQSRFWFYFARPELCTFGAMLGTSAALVPCAGIELGAITGVGSDIDEAETRTRFWAAADAKLALRVDISDAWLLEASGGVVAPFVRYEFVFRDPDTSVHRIPALGAVFGAKLGGRF